MEEFDWNDVSRYYRPNMLDQNVAVEISRHWETPETIRVFARRCGQLTDYSYWYLLGTLWVCYTGFTDLSMWKELFSADRRHRKDCIMKPSEVRAYDGLPYILTAYRAHRAGETDWISYTLDLDRAKKFANQRGVHEVKEYRIRRRDVLAYFTRRNESELLVLDKEKAEYVRSHYVAGGRKCEFCGNDYAEKWECGNTCCEECCAACDAQYPDNPCKYRAEELERREQAKRQAEAGSTQGAAGLTEQELAAIKRAAPEIAAGTGYTAEQAESRLKDFFRRKKADGES